MLGLIFIEITRGPLISGIETIKGHVLEKRGVSGPSRGLWAAEVLALTVTILKAY